MKIQFVRSYFFRITDVTSRNRINELNSDFSETGLNLQKLNNIELIEKSKEHHKLNFNDVEVFSENILFRNEEGEVVDLSGRNQDDFFAIVFCPVKGQKGNEKGVDFVYQNLDSSSKGFFYSSETEEESKEVQEHFENFTSDKTRHIVCTKAFGMGIDKKDIRSTYHFIYSGSLESLVQEAGRSGRDKKISEAIILVSKTQYVKVDVYKYFAENKENVLLQNKFTRKSIRQSLRKNGMIP